MIYCDLFLGAAPRKSELETFAADPVRVRNSDGSYHWHVLVTFEEYARRRAARRVATVYTAAPAKYRRKRGTREAPRHLFGALVRDPEVVEPISARGAELAKLTPISVKEKPSETTEVVR